MLVSDRGDEPLSSDVIFTIAIGDQIDYPPMFTQVAYNVRVTMEIPVNFELLRVKATTRDLTSSILYDIVSGDRSLFSINQETGVLVTTATLDPLQDEREYVLEVTAQHFHLSATVPVVVTIRRDDGIPRLEPLSVYFSVLQWQVKEVNFLGHVIILDKKEGVAYSFSLVNSDPCVRQHFSILKNVGEISVGNSVRSGVYRLNVSVSTAVATGYGEVVVYVRLLTNQTLSHVVMATFVGLSEASFISLQMEQFINFVAESVACRREAVEVVGVEGSVADTVNLVFAVRDATTLYYIATDTIIDLLSRNHGNAQLSTLIGYSNDVCVNEPCPNLQICHSAISMTTYRPDTPYRTLPLEHIVLVSQPFHETHTCHCPQGNTYPDLCTSTSDLCDPSPCHFGAVCTDNVLDYYCDCPAGTMGKNCSIICPSLSCDPCSHSPCQYGSVCRRDQDPTQYRCEDCPWDPQISGPNCELISASFSLGSFVVFPKLQFSTDVKFSFQFSTVSPNSLLLYSGRDSGRHDYISVELVIGQIRVGMSYGDVATTVRTESPWQLNDAEWHSVEVEVRDGMMSVRVGSCGPRSVEGADRFCQMSAIFLGNKR